MILGIDEVGRGAWAGPIVVGAVLLDKPVKGLKDSKLLSAKQREVFARKIYKNGSVGLGWCSNHEIDTMGLSRALSVAAMRAVEQIAGSYTEIIIDGTVNLLKGTTEGFMVTTLKKADQLIASVSAAAIVAKVARDEHMKEQSVIHPDYGFESHVGYGTSLHRNKLSIYGPCSIHRQSYEPIKLLMKSSSTVEIGSLAELKTAEFLKRIGHEILETNWKTKYCEIDVISKLGGRLYFTEVKYRRNNTWGDGLDAVNQAKLRKMRFAAQLYMKDRTEDYCLAVSSVSSDPMKVDTWLEIE